MAETATAPTLPSLRELELEELLRLREQQLIDLTVGITSSVTIAANDCRLSSRH